MDSYGYIETLGYVTSIVAADAALKAANVILTNHYFVTGGIVTVELNGDVAAVRAAVEAGSEMAKQLGGFLSNNVIARIDKETKKILVKSKKNTIQEEKNIEKNIEIIEEVQENTVEINITEINNNENIIKEKILNDEIFESDESESKKSIITENVQKNDEILEEKEEVISEEKEHIKKLKKEYQETRVIELKMKVNNLKLGYTWNQIKGMTKKKLIEILIKNNQEE